MCSYAIWLKLRDHICIKGTVPVEEFNATVVDIAAFFNKLRNSGLVPLYDSELGYFAENARNLASNLTVQVLLRIGDGHLNSAVEHLSKAGYKIQSKAIKSEEGKSEIGIMMDGPVVFNDQIAFINAVIDFINKQDIDSPLTRDDDQSKQE